MIRTCLIKCECVCGALFYVYILTVWNEEGSEKLLGALHRKSYRVFICLYLLSIWRVSLVQHAVNVKYPSVCEAPCHVKAIISGNLRADSNLIRGTPCICYTVKEGNKGWIKKMKEDTMKFRLWPWPYKNVMTVDVLSIDLCRLDASYSNLSFD